MRKLTILLFLSFVIPAFSQEWVKKEEIDPMTDKHSVRYTLTGTYLTAPKNASETDLPVLVVQCTPQLHNIGKNHTNGKYNEGYVTTPGGVVDTNKHGRISVEYRLDNDKAQTAYWNPSTDFSGAFLSYGDFGSGWLEFANLLYKHHAYHKDGTPPPQVQRIIVSMPEFMGTKMVMQFNLPDSREIADACGIISYKGKHK
jgi:hypothetical protein